jgi:hypothetical protein
LDLVELEILDQTDLAVQILFLMQLHLLAVVEVDIFKLLALAVDQVVVAVVIA